MSDKITACKSPNDPNRCQGVTSEGQCRNVKQEGFEFCINCGQGQEKKQIKKNYHTYLLKKQMHRVYDMSEDDHIKSLRDEVGILRMIIEQILNRCDDATDIILQSSALSDLVTKVERLVGTMHKLEGSMGQHLDKAALLQFATNMVGVISDEIDDDELINRISNKIIGSLNNV